MKKIDIVFCIVCIALICSAIIIHMQNREIDRLENNITEKEVEIVEEKEVKEISFIESIYVKSLKDEIKRKNKIIQIDEKLFAKHREELELYGDFIVGILKGEDRKERLMREEVLKTGEKMIEIKKEIEELKKQRDNN